MKKKKNMHNNQETEPRKLTKEELEEFYATHDIIDDSKMPTPEQAATLPSTPELDKLFEKEIDEIAKKYGIY